MLAGFVIGPFGAAGGFVLGFMLDQVRFESRIRSRLRRHLALPDEAGFEREGIPGSFRGAALVLGEIHRHGMDYAAAKPGIEAAERSCLAQEYKIAGFALNHSLSTLIRYGIYPEDYASLCLGFDRHADERMRIVVAAASYGVARSRFSRLDEGEAREIRNRLAACGIRESLAAAIRSVIFPDYKDPYDILDLPYGSSPALVRSAFRARSKRCHPDGPSPDAEGFMQAKNAFEMLCKHRGYSRP